MFLNPVSQELFVIKIANIRGITNEIISEPNTHAIVFKTDIRKLGS